MKEKILPFIIGVLVGAIIATIVFLVYNKIISSNTNQPGMMPMNENGQMKNDGSSQGDMNEPPEKPDGDNGEEPLEKPEETNNI